MFFSANAHPVSSRYLNTLAVALTLALYTGAVAASSPITQPIDDTFKWLEGGSGLPRSSSAYTTYRVGARFTASVGYSCGKFKFQNNASAALQRMRDQIQNMPNILAQAATGFVASAPFYLVKTFAPDVYGILTWNLDSAIELFRFDYKTCEQLESDIRNTTDIAAHNPYSDLMRASVLQRYSWGASQGWSIQQTKEDIENNPGAGGIDFLGNGRGTPANPIEVLHDVMLVGYNLRLHRGILDTSTPPNLPTPNAMVRIWPTPQDAINWIQRIAGEYRLVLAEGSSPEGASPQGVRAEIERVTELYQSALGTAVISRDYGLLDDLERNIPGNLKVPSSTIEHIRKLSDNQKGLAISSLSSGTATAVVVNSVQEAIQTLRQGAQAPDVVNSAAESVIGPLISKTILQLHDQLDEIAIMARINRELGNANRSNVDAMESATDDRQRVNSDSPRDKQPMIDGMVPKNPINPPFSIQH